MHDYRELMLKFKIQNFILTLNLSHFRCFLSLNNLSYVCCHRIPPPVVWAQRNDVLFVTVNVETKDPEIK